MKRYLLKRFLSLVVSAWAVVSIVFFLARITGDPVALLVSEFATDAEILELRARYGLDESTLVQYVTFFSRVWRGDFGQSMRHLEPALQAVLRYMPATIELALASLGIAVLGGVSLGVLAATRPGTRFDTSVMSIALLGQSIPAFWQGLMLILVFGLYLKLLPVSGRGGLDHLILPAITLGTTQMAAFARLARASMIDQLSQDYVRTARSRGISELRLVVRHALPNAAIPLVTQMGLTLGHLLAGTVITETIFAWPGIGRFALQAVYNRDFPVVQATVCLVAVLFLVINFLVDIAYTYIDPRVTLE